MGPLKTPLCVLSALALVLVLSSAGATPAKQPADRILKGVFCFEIGFCAEVASHDPMTADDCRLLEKQFAREMQALEPQYGRILIGFSSCFTTAINAPNQRKA